MDYNILLDLATDLGYELAMCGAETFRVEESVSRVLSSYGIASEVFAIPNYLIVTVMMEDGTPITRMRRIGSHGNDLDSVEKFSGLSRAYCSQRPEPKEAQRWMEVTRSQRLVYPVPIVYLGYFLGALGFGLHCKESRCHYHRRFDDPRSRPAVHQRHAGHHLRRHQFRHQPDRSGVPDRGGSGGGDGHGVVACRSAVGRTGFRTCR